MAETEPAMCVAAVRRFNRFYTRRIGVLQEGVLASPFSLTEMRVLYELAHRQKPSAAELCKDLGLDAGYLSRILQGLTKRRLVERERSPADGRQSLLSLSRQGRTAFGALDRRSSDEVAAMLSGLPAGEQERLTAAMATIEKLLARREAAAEPYVLRSHRPGDMGWVVHRHGVLYAQEHGYDERFEAVVADIVARFIQRHDPRRERCWIAERDGEIVGSVFLVQKSKTVGKLRLLLVEPRARGLGLGRRLVSECVRFAGQVGYRRITLWTHGALHAARRLYQDAGFKRVHARKSVSFGRELVDEIWELRLLPDAHHRAGAP